MKSYTKPTSEQLDAAIPRLSSPAHETYFFAHLENPHWVAPLADRGMFNSSPSAQRLEGGFIRFPQWPPSRYLVRMAARAPTDVANVLAIIRTDNASVIGDIVDAALAMPPNVAASLVPALCHGVKQRSFHLPFEDASELCIHLAQGGEQVAAMKLAIALFEPRFVAGRERPILHDEHRYSMNLAKIVPVLTAAKAKSFVQRLCSWLNRAVDAKRIADPNTGSDFSYSWRPAVEEHPENRDYDFAGVIAGFVRQSFEHAIDEDRLSLQESLEIIERYRYLIFGRMRLHLITQFADREPNLAREIMMNRQLFDDYENKHEYARLVGRRWGLLDAQQQLEWLEWVKAGPDLSAFEESFEANVGHAPSNDDRQNRIDYWQFVKLYWVRSFLEDEWFENYQRMFAKFGEPELADMNVRSGTHHWGAESPFSVEELIEMGFDEAVDTVSSWKPSGSRHPEPSVEGLASIFSQYVASNCTEFSAGAKKLIGRPSIYVRSFINRMDEAVKAGTDIDIAAVLELCDWVVGRPLHERTAPSDVDDALVDQDWQWTRNEISRLIEDVCQASVDGAPKYSLVEYRDPLWQPLLKLSRDPSKSSIVRDISQEDPRTHDYLQLGINSPQGKAVEAALEYARWVANHLKKFDGKRDSVPGGFDAIPEVRNLLESLVAPGSRSFETLSVIGSRIGLIYWIDKEWLAANANAIFGLDGIEETPPNSEGWAAWNAFLVWVQPHFEFYRIFKPQFAYAVTQAADAILPSHSHEQPMHDLGEHLMLLYGRGQIGLDDDDGLLRKFIESANPDIRGHAIGYVGQTFESDDDRQVEVARDVIERFMALWVEYWSAAGKEDAKRYPNSSLFGTWFASGQFPEQWALDRLDEFVDVAPLPSPIHEVAEKLADIASTDPTKSVRILDRMIRGDREGWHVHGWLDSAKKTLETAMAADGEARSIAESLIDHLGRRGYIQFGELLK